MPFLPRIVLAGLAVVLLAAACGDDPTPTPTPTIAILPTVTDPGPTATTPSLPTVATPSAVKIEKVILFPFTIENIRVPDLTRLRISDAPPGTLIAIIGSGFGSEIFENEVTFDGFQLPIWAVGPSYVATIIAHPQSPITGALEITSPKGTASVEFDMTAPTRISGTPGEVLQKYLDVLGSRFMSQRARDFVTSNLPNLLPELDGIAALKDDIERDMILMSDRELIQLDSMIAETGFIEFFEQNPPANSGVHLRMESNKLAMPRPLVDVASVALEIAVAAGIVGVVDLVAGSDTLPVATLSWSAFSDIGETETLTVTCTAIDDGLNETGLKSVRLYVLNDDLDATFSEPSILVVVEPEKHDLHTLTATLTPQVTGKNREGYIRCEAEDLGGHTGPADRLLVLRDRISPEITLTSVNPQSMTSAQIGADITVTLEALDVTAGGTVGHASGLDFVSLTVIYIEIKDNTVGKWSGQHWEFVGERPGEPQGGVKGNLVETVDMPAMQFACVAEGNGLINFVLVDAAGNVAPPVRLQYECFP